MTATFPEYSDLFDCVQDFVGMTQFGEVTPAQLAEFEHLLRESKEARRLYTELIKMSVHLPRVLTGIGIGNDDGHEGSATGGDGNSVQPSSFNVQSTPSSPPFPSSLAPTFLSTTLPSTVGWFSSGWPVAYLIATVIFGLGLLIGSVVQVSQPAQVARQSVLPSPSGRGAGGEGSDNPAHSHPTVGRITGMVDCRWAENPKSEIQNPKQIINHQSEIINPKSPVALGDRFALSSGLLEITYDTGAKVILQGPVTYDVESCDAGFLSLGKLTAKLEKNDECGMMNDELRTGASDIHHSSFITHPLFAVRTPSAVVTDLGTEFGVEVAHDGANQVRVFQGQVALQLSSRVGGSVRPVMLIAGEVAQVAADGRHVSRPTGETGARLAAFVRQFPKAGGKGAVRRYGASPTLVSLYTFDNTANNAVIGAPNGWLKTTDTAMPKYVTGPIGKAAIDFADSRWGDVGYVFCTSGGFPNSTAGLWSGTWALWVKWSGADKERVLTGDINDGQQDVEIYTHGDNVQLYIRAATETPGPAGKPQVFCMTQTGGAKAVASDGGPASWHHVALTYRLTTGQPGTGSGAIYVDGVAQPMTVDLNSISSASRFDPWMNEMRIGASGRAYPTNFMSGSMDDVAVWDNQLTSTQVKAVYNAGKALSYNAKDVQDLLDIFAGGPGTQGVVAGKTWQHTTGLKGSPGDVVEKNALILGGAGNGVQIVPEPTAGDATKH